MRYVQRDEHGVVIGHYANPQPFAQEPVADDHPDIEAFKQWRRDLAKPSAALHISGTIRRSPYARGLTRVLAKQLGLSEAALIALIVEAAEDATSRGAEVDG